MALGGNLQSARLRALIDQLYERCRIAIPHTGPKSEPSCTARHHHGPGNELKYVYIVGGTQLGTPDIAKRNPVWF
jgi:hypothetical protein